jgi:hypothetical protein
MSLDVVHIVNSYIIISRTSTSSRSPYTRSHAAQKKRELTAVNKLAIPCPAGHYPKSFKNIFP